MVPVWKFHEFPDIHHGFQSHSVPRLEKPQLEAVPLLSELSVLFVAMYRKRKVNRKIG